MEEQLGAGVEPAYLRSIFETGQHSDFVIKCGDRSWKVHQLVICSKSDYFKKACESSFKEGAERKITLLEDNASLVDRMLSWFYGQGYYTPSDGNAAQLAVFDASMHALADKYLAAGLKTECRRRLEYNVVKALRLIARDAIPSSFLIEAMEAAYTLPQASHREIRDSVMRGLQDGYSVLHPREEFQQLLRSNMADGDFVYDLMKCWVESATQKTYLCSFCGRVHVVGETRNGVGIRCSECNMHMGLYLNDSPN